MCGNSMATIEVGSYENPTILLLHGVTDSAASMADAITFFAKKFHVIACDLRGHGFSPTFDYQQITEPIETMVGDCIQLIKSLKRKVAIYGHSMGGAVASEVAIRYPNFVSYLIVEDPAWLDEKQRIEYRQNGKILADNITYMREMPETTLAQMKKECPRWSATELAGWYQAKCLVDLAFVRCGEVSVQREYQEIVSLLKVPTFLLTAQDDALINREKVEMISASQHLYISHEVATTGGHCLRRNNPEFFYPMVEKWLDSLSVQM